MEAIVTSDWSDFGHIEIEEAKNLLSHIKEIEAYGKVEVQFNRNSGCVFLVDEDYNVWMMNGDDIEEWFTCSYCGHEGFLEDFKHDPDNKDCIENMKAAGVDEDDIKEDD